MSLNYRRLVRRPKPSDVPRPFLGRSLLRLALSFHPKASEPRRARGKINSSGASSRLAPQTSEELHIACRRRSVLPSPSAPFWPLPAFRWRRGLPSRSPLQHARHIRVGEAKRTVIGLWITGISGTTAGTLPSRLKCCRSVLGPTPDSARISASSRGCRPSRFARRAGFVR